MTTPIFPSNLIAGRAIPISRSHAAPVIRSHNPARPGEIIWEGSPPVAHVAEAVAAARAALPAWSRTPIEKRAEALRAYKALCEKNVARLASLLCDETGKAMWEAEAEAKLLPAKVDVTLMDGPMSAGSGRARVTDFEIPITSTRRGRCSFRPHGVMAVLGPFNFPVHLPNGHIVPALLAGNTVVFKPSDKTPAAGQLMAELLNEALAGAGAPLGVVNLAQGGADVASALVAHDDIDGILFTGSWPVGRRVLEANLDRPGRIVALELGGNNAALVMPDADLKLAALECARAAFATTGQRCTCTRRIIVHESIASRFIRALVEIARSLLVGDPRGVALPLPLGEGRGEGHQSPPTTQPFMGPIIRAEARAAVLDFQKKAIAGGAKALLEPRAMELPGRGHYISPGILSVPRFSLAGDPALDCGCDVEVFGPLVRVSTCRSLDDGIAQANATRYGLAASLFSTDPAAADRFITEARAGCINVNTGTAGASSKLPFGGLGLSGNHRPAGAFSLDYCAYPVASMIETSADVALSPGMKFDEAWVR